MAEKNIPEKAEVVDNPEEKSPDSNTIRIISILKKIRKSENLSIFALPILGYLILYLYYSGYFFHFHIPSAYIVFEPDKIFTVIILLGFPVLFNGSYIFDNFVQYINERDKLKKIGFGIMFIYFFVTAFFITLQDMFIVFLIIISLVLFSIIFLLISYTHLLFSKILNSKFIISIRFKFFLFQEKYSSKLGSKSKFGFSLNQKKEVQSKSENNSKTKDNLSETYKNSNGLSFGLLCVLVLSVVWLLGYFRGNRQSNFLIISNLTPKCAVLYLTNDKIICSDVNLGEHSISDSFHVFSISDNPKFTMKTIETGILSIKKEEIDFNMK